MNDLIRCLRCYYNYLSWQEFSGVLLTLIPIEKLDPLVLVIHGQANYCPHGKKEGFIWIYQLFYFSFFIDPFVFSVVDKSNV